MNTDKHTDRIIAQVLNRRQGTVRATNRWIRDLAIYRALKPGRSPAQIRAAMLQEMVDLLPMVFPPDWTLAGEHVPHECGIERYEDCAETDLEALGLPRAEIPALRQALMVWRAGRSNVGDEEGLPLEGRGTWQDGKTTTVFYGFGWSENHSVRDYALLLRLGYSGLLKRIDAAQAAADPSDPAISSAWAAWSSLHMVAEAGISLARRYAQAARRQALDAADSAEIQRLNDMAQVLERVPEYPCTTLREAVQALWMGHLLACMEDGINANSIGRMDRILEPYYQADLAAGRIDRDGAINLMVELAAKMYLEYDVQAITIGGQDAEGRDGSGAMSSIILEATARVGWVRDLAFRWHPGTPPELLQTAARLVTEGGGIPFFFNDTCFVPALHERGVRLSDARDYAPIGCVELTIPGKADPRAVSGWFNLPKALELTIFNGRDPASGQSLGPATGNLSDHPTFDSFMTAFKIQIEFFAKRMVLHCNRGEQRQRDLGPLPAWSLLTDDCIARGRDITAGGALYDFHSICLAGVPDTADALHALRQMLYAERSVTAEELQTALYNNWQDTEHLRRRCLNQAKYGNDQVAVDALGADIANHFIDLMDGVRSPQGGRYIVHLFSFYINLPFGRGLGALPDGRRRGDPIAYSLSAHQGRDTKGITAMIHSLARAPHHRAAGGSAAIIEIDPNLVSGERGAQLIATLTQTAFAQGVGQLQWNVVSAERLKQAQEDPERLGSIAVRVAGYSQQFRLIPTDLQNHIIARTKHRG